MQQVITFEFPDQQVASRFLEDIKSGQIHGARAKRANGGYAVRVTYPLAGAGQFSTAAQELDDLAQSLGGREV